MGPAAIALLGAGAATAWAVNGFILGRARPHGREAGGDEPRQAT
jgi:hypothetical protein